MRAYFYEDNIWTGTDSLWQALGLTRRIGARPGIGQIDAAESQAVSDRIAASRAVPGPFVISLAGAGGKTSTIRRLAFEAVKQGIKVLVVTTTHMACPEDFAVLTGGREEVAAVLKERGLAVAGLMCGKEKIAFTGQELYEEICPMAGLVLVEADGSRRLPLKVPGRSEPVIPGNTDLILCLSGLSCLGKRAEDCCLRLEQARVLMDAHGRPDYESGDGWSIRKEDMMCLMKYGYLSPLREHIPGTPVVPVFNQADTKEESEMVRKMLWEMGEESGIAVGRQTQDLSAGLF